MSDPTTPDPTVKAPTTTAADTADTADTAELDTVEATTPDEAACAGRPEVGKPIANTQRDEAEEVVAAGETPVAAKPGTEAATGAAQAAAGGPADATPGPGSPELTDATRTTGGTEPAAARRTNDTTKTASADPRADASAPRGSNPGADATGNGAARAAGGAPESVSGAPENADGPPESISRTPDNAGSTPERVGGSQESADGRGKSGEQKDEVGGRKKKRGRRGPWVTVGGILAVLVALALLGYLWGIGPLNRLNTARGITPPNQLGGLDRIADPEIREQLQLDQTREALSRINDGKQATVEAYGTLDGNRLFVVIALRGKVDINKTVADSGATPDQVKRVGRATCVESAGNLPTQCYRGSNTLTVIAQSGNDGVTVDAVAPVAEEAFDAMK